MVAILAKVRGDGAYYWRTLGDYYADAVEPAGRWFDPAGISGQDHGAEIDPEPFRQLMRGRLDDGTPIARNLGSPDRVPGFDMTFCAPKSVALCWAFGDPDLRERIEAAHTAAVAAGMRYLSAYAAQTRTGHAGRNPEPVAIVAALFQHGDSRPEGTAAAAARHGDPLLHVHAVIANGGRDAAGTWRSLDARLLYRSQKAIGRAYHDALARELRDRAGLATDPDGRGNGLFRVAGIPIALERAFSSRANGINQRLRERGIGHSDGSAAGLAHRIGLATRGRKEAGRDRDRHAAWRRQAREAGFEPDRVIGQVRRLGRDRLLGRYRQAVLAAVQAPPGSTARERLDGERREIAATVQRLGLSGSADSGSERAFLDRDAAGAAGAAAALRTLAAAIGQDRGDGDGGTALRRPRSRLFRGQDRDPGGQGPQR